MFDRMTHHGSAALAALAFMVLAPGTVEAQEVDRRWLPWTGCWEMVGGQQGDGAICVDAGETTLEVVLVDDNPETSDPRIRADGQPREVTQFGCDGTERARFSPDGRRIYIEGRYLCDDGVEQTSTGLVAMVTPDEWVDIRSLEMGGERVAWVQRYVAATPEALRAAGAREALTAEQALARRMAARDPSVEELVEVAQTVDPRVATAWVGTVGSEFDLDGETLLAMHEAGVDDEVIDVAVAVSNPDYFSLGAEGVPGARDRTVPRSAYAGPVTSPFAGGCWGRNSFFLPWGGAFGCNAFFGYGYGFNYGFDPYYGYGWGGRWGGGWGGYWGPTIVVVDRDPGSNASQGGRAVAGRGYRGPRNNPTPSGSSFVPPRSSGSSGGAVTRGGAGSRGGAATRGGGTRRAKPKGGGGGH